MPPVYFRYILPHNAASDRDLLYFPYWRFKGMLFSCVSGRVNDRFVDTSQQAVTSKYFPFSVGLRPQVGKLTFATKKSKGRFLRPDIAYANVIDLFKNSLTRFLPKPIHYQSYVGDVVSLLYAPFYLSNHLLFDAILNKPVTNDMPEDLTATLKTSEKIQNETHFFPAICPACSWDLDGEGDVSVLLCKNCQTAWQPTQKGFTKLPSLYLSEMGQFKISLPFWRIKADIDGVSLRTIADLARVANLPDISKGKDPQTRFHFWVPAFKVRPKVLLTLCQRVTVAQPVADGDQKLPDGAIVPANLPVNEASEMLKIVLAGFAKSSKVYFPKLNQIQITPRKALLVYIPFSEDHHDFIQPKLNLGLRKRLLTLAENL